MRLHNQRLNQPAQFRIIRCRLTVTVAATVAAAAARRRTASARATARRLQHDDADHCVVRNDAAAAERVVRTRRDRQVGCRLPLVVAEIFAATATDCCRNVFRVAGWVVYRWQMHSSGFSGTMRNFRISNSDTIRLLGCSGVGMLV